MEPFVMWGMLAVGCVVTLVMLFALRSLLFLMSAEIDSHTKRLDALESWSRAQAEQINALTGDKTTT